ncbi:MAG: YifB family Mg chelatase-like AAA ATPase [Epsilonproteobacteria bacterium]|nr:Fis family transcriptional regulator [Campylobacterota bacterium]NPA57163.1 YifB family Mg chelatase-like AAA ATPase [Campylobacterota bacterium]
MLRLRCAALQGGKVHKVDVERSFTRGLPSFSVVGLAGNSIQEAKERVKSALDSCGFKFPPKRITINLSPSDIKKSGSHFDLAIALSIALDEKIRPDENLYIFGELGLDGSLKDTVSLFPIVLDLASTQKVRILAPSASADKLAPIPNVELYTVNHLREAIQFFNGKAPPPLSPRALDFPTLLDRYYYQELYELDFRDVKGQRHALRAALISAAGWHNILFEGSPGCGKSMIAKRLRYILPPLELREILEIAKMEVLDGREPHFTPLRPMRSPHHSSTKASIFGGGSREAKPGEVAFANKGILFFDELPHFSRGVLEALREPLQERRVLISRVNQKVEYESDFIFVAAQNPCPCGYLLSRSRECRCTELEIKRYRNRLSGPLLDRIELYVQMSEIEGDETPSTSSRELHQRVREAFVRQMERQGTFNGKLQESQVEEHCTLTDEGSILLTRAVQRFGLSLRQVNNIKKVARTIADLAGHEIIEKQDILEALGYIPKFER